MLIAAGMRNKQRNQIHRQLLLREVVCMHLCLVHSSANVSLLCNFYLFQNVHSFRNALLPRASKRAEVA